MLTIIRDVPVHHFKNKETGEEVMVFELQEPTIVHLEDGPKAFYPHDYEVVHGDGKVTLEDKLTFELAFEEVELPKIEEPPTPEPTKVVTEKVESPSWKDLLQRVSNLTRKGE